MQVTTTAEQLFFTTVYVAAGDEAVQWTGTGFVIEVEVEEGVLHLLVTNKHVLRDARNLTLRMIRAGDGVPMLGHSVERTYVNLPPDAWQGHGSDDVDVAVLPIGWALNSFAEAGEPPFFRSVGEDKFLTVPLAEELDALEEVTFIGYPSGLYDSANFLPIARRGTTATPVTVDYNGLPAFLIDASVFPGSSGSPVFLVDHGPYLDRSGNTKIGGRLALLGVLAAVHVRESAGRIVQLPSKLGVVVPEALDLGIVFKANAIREVVDALLVRIGRTRKATVPSTGPDEVTQIDRDVSAGVSAEAELRG